ncbi:MAG: hypothetical protein NUV47_01545 [Patescibacteria group bacterium]|nr:hypothetical protein [Patescibacteria group bacterium]
MIISHKKIGIVFITSTFVLGGIFVLVHYNNIPQKIDSLATITANEKTFNELANKDSDNDGLKDWEETLWKTDLHNQDSDGDKIPDGQEVKEGRNPTIPGPNDSLADHPLEPKNTGVSQSNLSETDKFARSIFSKYMTMKQGGVPMDINNQTGLVQNILQNQNLDVNTGIYSKKDLQLSTDNESSIKQYANEMAHILMTYSISSKDPAIIAQDSMLHNNPDEIKELDPLIKSYSDILSYSLKIKVPPSAVNVQIALLNSLSDMISTIKSMRTMYSDPLFSLKGFGHYGDILPLFAQTLEDLKNFVVQQKIPFLPSDEGYVFGRVSSQ